MVNQTALAQALSNCAARDLIDLGDLEVKALAKIMAGGGELPFTINGAQNGKSAAQECRYDAGELLVVIDLAKSLPPSGDGENVTISYVDMSDIDAPCGRRFQ